MNFKEQFKKIIDENAIVLFMKGTKDAPVCGFSNTVVPVSYTHLTLPTILLV